MTTLLLLPTSALPAHPFLMLRTPMGTQKESGGMLGSAKTVALYRDPAKSGVNFVARKTSKKTHKTDTI